MMVIASKLIELLRKKISVILYGPPVTLQSRKISSRITIS